MIPIVIDNGSGIKVRISVSLCVFSHFRQLNCDCTGRICWRGCTSYCVSERRWSRAKRLGWRHGAAVFVVLVRHRVILSNRWS